MVFGELRSKLSSLRAAVSGLANHLGKAAAEDQQSESSPRRIQIVLDQRESYLDSAFGD
jgi:hypothetical protein